MAWDPYVMYVMNPGLYCHLKNETRKDNEGIDTKFKNEVKNSTKSLWKAATEQQSKINQTIEKIKEENSSLFEPLEHNHIEKRSVVANLPAHVDRFSDQDLVGSNNSFNLATVSLWVKIATIFIVTFKIDILKLFRVYIVLGFGVVVILLVMTVLFPLLYRKYLEKSNKGNLYTSYADLGSEALSQVWKLI